jgi:ribosome-associated protein
MAQDHDDDEEDLGPSRSQRRREALAVFDLGRALVELSDAQLAHVPLSDELRDLVIDSRRITANIARKRQLQFLAKHLRKHEDELPAIRAALEHDRDGQRRETAKLHRIEAWRDRLIAGGDEALEQFLAEHPDADRQRLRQLARRARDEQTRDKPPAASRELVRTLRDVLSPES